MALSGSTCLNPERPMSSILSIALLGIGILLLAAHFIDIRNTHNRND